MVMAAWAVAVAVVVMAVFIVAGVRVGVVGHCGGLSFIREPVLGREWYGGMEITVGYRAPTSFC